MNIAWPHEKRCHCGVPPPGGRAAGYRDRKITREVVLAAKLEIIDCDGVDGLSMRRLARALDGDPMILYRHAPTRAALLEGAAETVLAQLTVDPADPGWAAQLRTVARGYRRLARATPEVWCRCWAPGPWPPRSRSARRGSCALRKCPDAAHRRRFCDRRSSLAAVGTHGDTAAPEMPGPPCCSYVTSAVSWPSWPGPP